MFKKVARYMQRKKGKRSIQKTGFWFVDIPRTSSTSIRSEIGKHFGSVHGKVNVEDDNYRTDQIFPDHQTARQMIDVLGEHVWSSLFTFTFVRNPWDRMLSLYYWRMKAGSLPASMTFSEYVNSLYEFIKEGKNKELFRNPCHYLSACAFIEDEHGEQAVSFVGKFENRSEDLNIVSEIISMPNLGSVRILKAKPEDCSYRHLYDDSTENMIKEIYDKDIRRFDYHF